MRFGVGRWGALALLALVLGSHVTQAGAANEPALKPLKKIAVLRAPPLPDPAITNYQFGTGFTSQPVPIFIPIPVKNTNNYGESLGGSLLASGIIALVQHEKRKSEVAMAKILTDIGLQPQNLLNAKIGPLLAAKGVENFPAISEQRTVDSSGKTVSTNPASQADAVLDIRVDEYGYFSSMRAGGYSPLLSVTAALTDPATGEEIESFTYYSDWRKSEEDPRWFTCDPEAIFPDMEALQANVDKARSGFEKTLDKMLVQIAEDIHQRAMGVSPNQNN